MSDNVTPNAQPEIPLLLKRLQDHFGQNPAKLPVVEQNFAIYERSNLHLAIEEYLSEKERTFELIGVLNLEEYRQPSLARLSRAGSAIHFDEGPIEYKDVPLPKGENLSCVKNGLYLVRDRNQPMAILINEVDRYHVLPQLDLEIMALEREQAEKVLRHLTRQTHHGKAFREQILSIEENCYGSVSIEYHQLPQISREQIILPEKLLQRIERQTLSFSRQAEKLRAAGRHLKRGILLYGPPGTGKTLSAMYLVSQMTARTVLLMTGAAIGSIETACKLARLLAPSTVILEDVDLIGTERGNQTVGANALLFELLNQMDGLAEDIDILFILTTNRPDILEPALASRPGRIDQAIEIPPPDEDCRRRLIQLYGYGLDLKIDDWDHLVRRIEGVSAAFIRELLRKAAVFAAEESDEQPLCIQDRHIEEGLSELLFAGGQLTRSLLGAVQIKKGEE
jgi:cell division protease FtsH